MIINPKSLAITQLLSAESEQYIIPAYQRRYSWHQKQLSELLDDINLLEGSDNHLLGSIVCLVGYHKAGINELELVDGQQRLTTIFILLQCIADRLKKEAENAAAQDIDRLLQARALGENPVRKIVLDSLDSGDFEKLMAGKTLEEPSNQNLALAFSTFRTWVDGKALKELSTFLYRLKNQCTVIRLDVSDAKDAFKLFETINNRGLKLSPTDIIKNFILGNAARFGKDSLTHASAKWAELLLHLDGTSIESFFRNFLCARLKKRITTPYVIPHFKIIFMQQVAEAAKLPEQHFYTEAETGEDEELDVVEKELLATDEQQSSNTTPAPKVSFADFLDHVVASAKIYGQIVLAKTGTANVDRHLRNLRMIKSLQTYGFLMALRTGGCNESTFVKVLKLTESFLIRRHICRERGNDNEALFARLCGVSPTNPLPEVIEEFRKLSPTDDKFRLEFSKFDFTANLIDRARYCLEQFEQDKQGKYPEILVAGPEAVHVEHIIPVKIKTKKAKDEFGDWSTYLGHGAETKHPYFVSKLGNLTLFAGPLNQGASNNPFERKKPAYLKSAIKLTSSLPTIYPDFGFEDVEKRSADFAELAVKLWPIP